MSYPPYDPDQPPNDPGYNYGYGYGQPGYGAPPPAINNYLVPSILATIFCCWPLGIPAIINAAKVNQLLAMGDIHGAQEAARKAKMWTIWSVASIGVVVVLYAIAAIIGLAMSGGNSTTTY